MTLGLLHRVRRRVLWVAAGVLATAAGLLIWTAAPALPIVGVAFATIAVAMNSLSRDIRPEVCLECAHDLKGQPRGTHGVICPSCGSIQDGPQHRRA